MSQTLTYTETLEATTCWCGIHLAVPANLLRNARNNGTTGIYCPLGHQFYFDSENEKLRKQLQRERDRAARLAAQRDQAEASARAHKGAATKARKRAAAAVCPCCKRSFVQLRRHMAAKHPDYDPETAAA
jgi:hypothetical protein